MKTTYSPQALEKHWYAQWEKMGYFSPQGTGVSYCIMIPPPNVTGTLHMGHAFQYTLMDCLIRYQRMQERMTLWQPGTDHAGIATQMVVERQLEEKESSRLALGREKFIEEVWRWKAQSGSEITQQMRRMGVSVDWERERFTLDDGMSDAVSEAFISLYDEGLIYRGKRLVNWDPVLHTAVSDLEVVAEEEAGFLWHIRYPLQNGDYLVIATTRPETMLGDSAVAVHPDDVRYQSLIGQSINLPLTDRKLKIIADDYVDPDFGTGCVKITPAHDFNDYEMGKRHALEMINIFSEAAQLNSNVPEKYQGMDRFVARKQIIADLTAMGLIEKIQAHRLKVPRGDRTGAVIEPLLTDQWFVDAKTLAKPAISAVEEGLIKFIPKNWENTYFDWMRNIQDWCISRQLWWGHRIPAWYDAQGKIYVGRSEEDIKCKYNLPEALSLTQDPDVLDTWFSSAMWPFSTLGWPQQSKALHQFYPTNVLVTGFDIIFFWVARMVMMGIKFIGKVPFNEVYVHGLVLDAQGQKMSKSKGNTLDPIDLIDGIDLESLVKKRTRGLMKPAMAPSIEKETRQQFAEGIESYGTDALRFTFAAMASTGRDIRFDMHRIQGYRNFCNKLWNASRYVMMNLQENDFDANASYPLGIAEQWIISRLQTTEAAVVCALNEYRFDIAAQAIYEFTWNEYCDWYLEFSKPTLQKADADYQQGCQQTLIGVLEVILRLAHPIIPFITEEIWQKVAVLAGKKGDTIMMQPYPQADDKKKNDIAEGEIGWMKQFILGIRQIRGEMNINPGKKLSILLQNWDDNDYHKVEKHQDYLKSLAKLAEIKFLSPGENAPESATALVDHLKILIPMAGLIDIKAESARLDKAIAKAEKERARCEAKLANENFVKRAKPVIVAQERKRVKELLALLDNLGEQFDKIKRL